MRFSPEVTAALADAATQVGADEDLTRAAMERHRALLDRDAEPDLSQWPYLPEAPLLDAIVLLSGVPRLREMHTARGIDEAVTVATLADLELWIRHASERDGHWSFRETGWLIHHLRGRLFALGRLQYLPGEYRHPFRFYRHHGTGRVLALAEDGLRFRVDGQFVSADGGAVKTGAFASHLAEDERGRTVTGNYVDPRGYVSAGVVSVTLPDWEEILRSGDAVLTTHIPASGPMTPEECAASFEEAARFFPAHVPEVKWRAFTCHSWLLDPQFEDFDPQPANIVSFLRSWYLHPTEGASGAQAIQRVLGTGSGEELDLAAAPRDTSLRRGILGLMEKGGRCRDGGSVFFADDLPFGPGRYRRR